LKASSGYADVLDRLTILEIKADRLGDARVRVELEALREDWAGERLGPHEAVDGYASLRDVNGRLWSLEDEIRALERAGDFGVRFVAVSREIRRLNDERAAIKRQINGRLGSPFSEVKSHPL
jgi:hypothetical protein